MKIAYYLEEGCSQLVLTPENRYERRMLELVPDGTGTVSITRANFYKTIGGFVVMSNGSRDESTVLVIEPPAQPDRVEPCDDGFPVMTAGPGPEPGR